MIEGIRPPGISAEGYRAIADRCPIGVLVQRTQCVVYINRAGVDCLGYAGTDELRGKPLAELWDPSSYAILAPNLQKMNPHDNQVFIGELRLRCKSGQLIDAEVHHVGLSDGGDSCTMISFRDVTLTKRLEVELRSAQKLESVGRLAAGIAHEINTPAQFVGDSIAFVKQAWDGVARLVPKYRQASRMLGSDDATAAEIASIEQSINLDYLLTRIPRAFERSFDGITRISNIVAAMKQFAHPGHEEKRPADLNQALKNTLIIAHNEYKYVADIETSFGDIPAVVCQLADLNQVFLNLIVNSAHAIEEVVASHGGRGIIRIRTEQEMDMVRVDIEDSGGGIPDAVKDRVFDPFFTTKPVGKGSGQGLAIARSIVVDRHDGRLTFESKVGVGTTFTIRLPIDGNSHAEGAEA